MGNIFPSAIDSEFIKPLSVFQPGLKRDLKFIIIIISIFLNCMQLFSADATTFWFKKKNIFTPLPPKKNALSKDLRVLQVFRPSAGSEKGRNLYCKEFRTKLGFWFFKRHDVVFDKKIMRQITWENIFKSDKIKTVSVYSIWVPVHCSVLNFEYMERYMYT